VAVIGSTPTGVSEVLQLAWPLERAGVVHSRVEPVVKLTVPVGEPADEETVAE
jgi:hypothetical protein